ncbi:hypothetical protein AKG98_687 [Moritella sp. JT01]|nr:hypothetical protein AKG98_687 [Moritella sp. JT01]
MGGHTRVTCEDGVTSAYPKICVSALEQAYDGIKIYHKALSKITFDGASIHKS